MIFAETKQKSEAELQIEAMANIFNIATTGFADFYKEAENQKSASSGDYSKSASSGDHSRSASSGDHSRSASSGYSSTSASSGHYSTSASSGHYSRSASSGDYSTSNSSGYSSESASSGDYSTSNSSGDYSKSASSGDSSKSASSGDHSRSASSGDHSRSASSGDHSRSASSGYSSKSASSGDYSTSASSGHYSRSASSGDYSKSASSGDYSSCAAVGFRSMVKGDIGNLLLCSEYKDKKPVGGLADIVDGKKLKPDCWYIVESNQWVEVDFSDNIFSYVLSRKGDVKKVKTESGKVLYVVTDADGNSSHGETIKQARTDLIYKVTVNFDGKIPEKSSGKEWVGIYRAITGACSFGIKAFVEEVGADLDATYTAKEICEITNGRFGSDAFAKRINKGA